jgi:competence protein ComEC
VNGLSRVVAAARARPWHVALGGLVLGLLAGAHAPPAVLVAIVALPILAARAAVRLLVIGVVLLGAIVGQARLAAVDASRVTHDLGHAVATRVVLLETPRARAFGAREATVGLRGERVLLRAGRGVRWPTDRIGAVLAVRGGLEPLPPTQRWLRARAVHARLRADSIADTGLRRGGLAGVVDGARERAGRALQVAVPEREGALLRGMALGDDAALADDVRQDFRVSGLSHLVAASGQNVMLLAALALAVASVAGLGIRTRLALVLLVIAVYVPLAGAGASIQRAGVMGAAGVVAVLAGRPAARWYALLLAAAVTLTLNPRAIEDVGWQLSFAAVVAILLLAPRLVERLSRRGLPGAGAEAVALTAAATLGTAPLIALHFDQTSLVSLPANVAAAPAVAPVMWLGMAAAAAGQVWIVLAEPFTALAAVPAAYLTWLAHVAANVPGAQARAPVVVVVAVCAIVALAIAVRRSRRLVLTGGAVAVAVGAVLARPGAGGLAAPAGLRITFLDVGQGDATLVQERGTAMLVDTGPPDGPILGRLRHAGVRRLDLLVITHAQADHDGAAAQILGAMPVRLVLDGRDGVRDQSGSRMAHVAADRRVRLAAPAAGEVLRLGAIVVRVLWPPPDPVGARVGADPNARAIVAEVEVDGVRTLLTADAESDVLDQLDLGAVDILKVSHHGSADAGLPGLLERLRPRLAAIEVGRRNSYGHPAPSTVRALVGAGAALVRTDRDGSVRVEPAGRALRVYAHA